jgi:hypothetical protein
MAAGPGLRLADLMPQKVSAPLGRMSTAEAAFITGIALPVDGG